MSKITSEEVDKAIVNLVATATPEALDQLREQYGVTFDPNGHLVEVREPKKLRKAVRNELEQQEDTPSEFLTKLSAGAGKTGEVLLYGLVDAPIEGAKTAKTVTGSAARNAKAKLQERGQRSKAAHQRRLENAAERREARKQRKAAREALKAEQESQEQPEG